MCFIFRYTNYILAIGRVCHARNWSLVTTETGQRYAEIGSPDPAVPSSDPLAICPRSSGEKARQVILSSCPASRASSAPESASQTIIMPFPDPPASRRPSGENVSKLT